MNWNHVVAKLTPYIVKIETPMGSGTGFLCTYNDVKNWCGIATALHVVEYAEQWQQPIRVHHFPTKQQVFLKESNRVIYTDYKTDSAVILFQRPEKVFPDDLIPLVPRDKPISIGVEVGWLGFPGIEPYTLCFFSGNVSARRDDRSAYLVDGVAINGVSGGPVIFSNETDGVQIVGTVSAYRANRTGGESLPGLLIAQDVSHFHEVIQHIRSVDEARRKKQELQESPKDPNTKVVKSIEPEKVSLSLH